MPAGPSSRPRKLVPTRALEAWFERNDVEAWGPVADALEAIQDGMWTERYAHLDEVSLPGGTIMFIEPDLVMVWQAMADHPIFRVIFLGHPDEDID